LICPWHKWEFGIRTGRSFWNPRGPRARPIPLGIEAGETLSQAIESDGPERAKGPFAAEMAPVEHDYVVLTPLYRQRLPPPWKQPSDDDYPA
jgi:hypothetical protein